MIAILGKLVVTLGLILIITLFIWMLSTFSDISKLWKAAQTLRNIMDVEFIIFCILMGLELILIVWS